MGKVRTDLAMETRESIAQEAAVVSGVKMSEQEYYGKEMKVTEVEIVSEEGAKVMEKPRGKYITIELSGGSDEESLRYRQKLSMVISNVLSDVTSGMSDYKVMIVGLGNRAITADAIGPRMVDELLITRNMGYTKKRSQQERQIRQVSAIAAGVMAQTGMETFELLHGLVNEIEPELIFAVDALASRSMKRVGRTIQITNTGIHPGAGIGNHRKSICRETLGVPVIGIGVPTVIDAKTIVRESMETAFTAEGFSPEDYEGLIVSCENNMGKNMFVTPNDIDCVLDRMVGFLAEGINEWIRGKS